MLDQNETLSIVSSMLGQIGRDAPFDLVELAGGRNNRVAKIVFSASDPLVLKSYFYDCDDQRDRLGAEFSFLEMAWRQGVRNIPQPLACDRSQHVGLYGFLPGKKMRPDEISTTHVDAAVNFIVAINQSDEVLNLAPASEACFSIDAHMATVAARVARLDRLGPDVPFVDEVAALVEEQVKPMWQEVVAQIDEANSEPNHSQQMVTGIASPSDFGFHNALVDGDSVAFLDFEYAGLDDPAKLVCDFFCQPEVPVASLFFEQFIEDLGERLSLDDGFGKRSNLLLNAYHIKWVCIMLNEFADIGRRRRLFSGGEVGWARRCREQFVKAEHSLSRLSTRLV